METTIKPSVYFDSSLLISPLFTFYGNLDPQNHSVKVNFNEESETEDLSYLYCSAEDDCDDSVEWLDFVYKLVRSRGREEASIVITPVEKLADQTPLQKVVITRNSVTGQITRLDEMLVQVAQDDGTTITQLETVETQL